MELVYLWVEKYKNIKNQGFNFSPRFECDYKDENLIINPKEYIENFFDDKGNINVTAIVGENGSGKSSVLDFISRILLSNEKKYKYFLVCCDNENDLVLYKYFNKEIIDINSKIKNSDENIEENILDNYKNLLPLHIDNNDINFTPIENIDNATKMISNTKQYPSIKFIKDSNKFFLPTKVKISIKNKRLTEEEQKKVNEFNTKIKESLNLRKYDECLTDIKAIIKIFNNTKYQPETTSSFILNYAKNSKVNDNLFYDTNIQEVDNEYLKFIKEVSCLDEDIDIELWDEDKSFKELSYGEKQLLQILHGILYSFITNKVNTIYYSYYDEGEEINDTEHIDIKKYLIFIDEFELGLHPNWQKKALSYMIDFFKLFDIKIDLFITSHSPFMLSDLPKENIIFLKNGKQEYPFKDKQTFGANIHTLLSHGFFMEDGLMGEFAKGKIEEIKKFYDENKDLKISDSNFKKQKTEYELKIDNFNNIQKIIGEPFLQTIIKNYLDELNILFNGKNQFFDNEIKRLQSLKDS